MLTSFLLVIFISIEQSTYSLWSGVGSKRLGYRTCNAYEYLASKTFKTDA